jgi:hypothetical protein
MRARRMRIDQDIWVTEYRGNKVATEKFTNTRCRRTHPYAAVDKNGEIWTGGMQCSIF